MRRLFYLLVRLFGRTPLALAMAAAMLLCWQSQAQDTNTTGSLAQLQDDLINGVTNAVLAFNGTLVTTAPLEIVEDLTIDATGFSVIIQGNTAGQIFYVDPGVNFTLINVTLVSANNTAAAGTAGANGSNSGTKGGAGGNGGAGSNALGGAVFNAGNSRFISCLFQTNTAVGGAGAVGGNGGNGSSTGANGGNGGSGGVGYGGAIYNLGTLLLSNCSVTGNTATGGAGAAGGTNGTGPFGNGYPGASGAGGGGSGAGIYNLGVATLVNTTFNLNACLSGSASQAGGGTPGGNGNGATGAAGVASQGGGVCNFGTNNLLNCTFFANTATGGTGGTGGTGINSGKGGTGGNGGNALGGGIYNGPGGIAAVTNCTFSGDSVNGGTNGVAGTGPFAGNNGSAGSVAGANIANGNSGATFLLKNTILAFPTNTTSAAGTITDQGNNISSDATPAFTTTNSSNNKSAALSPSGLQSNGSTGAMTIALSANSPAINAIFDGSAPAFDARNFPRPGQIRPDIGAYEFGSFSTNFDVQGQVTIGGQPFPGVTVSAGTISTVTGINGQFQFSLPVSNTAVIHPNPQAYFSPQGTTVYVTNNTSGLLFNATNATGSISNSVSTNTDTLNISFAGIPGFTYIVQAASNLEAHPIIWTNLATNTSSSNGALPFAYPFSGTNSTNFIQRYFRAVIP